MGGLACTRMRTEAAVVVVLGVLGWCAAPASAAPTVLAQWTLDEGIGQVAGDTSGHANTVSSDRPPAPTRPTRPGSPATPAAALSTSTARPT